MDESEDAGRTAGGAIPPVRERGRARLAVERFSPFYLGTPAYPPLRRLRAAPDVVIEAELDAALAGVLTRPILPAPTKS